MKVLTVVGARPQFIKAAPVSTSLRMAGHTEVLVHTGQHYDRAMSSIFFDELGIPEPNVNLGVGSASHATQTAQMLTGLEEVMVAEEPDWVLVYGDTNTTLAGALAACKLQIPIAHVESGLRSFNRAMPEEHNRVLVDHCADLLFCPTSSAAEQLAREGITRGVHVVGDTMYDAVRCFGELARARSRILEELDLVPRGYLLATIHRAYNTDDTTTLESMIDVLAALELPVVFPVHPRTRARLNSTGKAALAGSLRMIEPVGYLDMLVLEQNARMVLTDSGGMQKEAYFFGVPCVTLRPETEWTETVAAGWNVVAGTDPAAIQRAIRETTWPTTPPPQVFGDGSAAARIVGALEENVRHRD